MIVPRYMIYIKRPNKLFVRYECFVKVVVVHDSWDMKFSPMPAKNVLGCVRSQKQCWSTQLVNDTEPHHLYLVLLKPGLHKAISWQQ